MRRLSCPELHERPWFPRLWRDELTEFLSLFAWRSGIYRPAVRKLAAILADPEIPAVYTDLCAGAGTYDLGFVRSLRKLTGRPVQARLTDLYPNANWRRLAAVSGGLLLPVEESCPAETAIARCDGLLTMFSGVHHFGPEALGAMVRCAAEHGRTVAFFDYSHRTVVTELLPMLFSVPLVMLLAPLVWPFSWKRLLFSWVVPVLPLLLLIDGWLSRLRAYHADELRAVAEQAAAGKACTVESGAFPVFGGLARVTFLVVSPRKELRSPCN